MAKCSSVWKLDTHNTLHADYTKIVNGIIFEVCFISLSYLEAEGMEKTYKIKQEEIACAVPLTNSQQVLGTV